MSMCVCIAVNNVSNMGTVDVVTTSFMVGLIKHMCYCLTESSYPQLYDVSVLIEMYWTCDVLCLGSVDLKFKR